MTDTANVLALRIRAGLILMLAELLTAAFTYVIAPSAVKAAIWAAVSTILLVGVTGVVISPSAWAVVQRAHGKRWFLVAGFWIVIHAAALAVATASVVTIMGLPVGTPGLAPAIRHFMILWVAGLMFTLGPAALVGFPALYLCMSSMGMGPDPQSPGHEEE